MASLSLSLSLSARRQRRKNQGRQFREKFKETIFDTQRFVALERQARPKNLENLIRKKFLDFLVLVNLRHCAL